MIVNHTSVFLELSLYTSATLYYTCITIVYLMFFWSDVFKIVSESLFWSHVTTWWVWLHMADRGKYKITAYPSQSFKLLRIFGPIVNSWMCKVIFRIFHHVCMNFISKGLFKIVAWMLTRQLMNMPAFLLFNIWSRDKIWTNALAYSKYGGGYAGINYWCKYSKYFEG